MAAAQRERDNGVDLIIFQDPPWRAVPIQLKVLSKPGWNICRKYESEPDLRMVHV